MNPQPKGEINWGLKVSKRISNKPIFFKQFYKFALLNGTAGFAILSARSACVAMFNYRVVGKINFLFDFLINTTMF